MLNQIIIVGRLVSDLEVRKTESDKSVANITVAVPRNFKNSDGVYETDFIDCVVWNGVAENTAEYCHKGDIIGIKGRMQTKTKELDGKKINSLEVVAEKVTFLSTREPNKNKENDEPAR